MDRQLKLLSILTALFLLTAGLCCTSIQLEIGLQPTTDTITVITKDTIPKKYNKYCSPQYDTATRQYTYKVTDSPLTIYSISCTKTTYLSQERDNIQNNLPIDYLKIITKDKKEYTANSKKEIMELFLEHGGENSGHIKF